jgi:hypothetical protein
MVKKLSFLLVLCTGVQSAYSAVAGASTSDKPPRAPKHIPGMWEEAVAEYKACQDKSAKEAARAARIKPKVDSLIAQITDSISTINEALDSAPRLYKARMSDLLASGKTEIEAQCDAEYFAKIELNAVIKQLELIKSSILNSKNIQYSVDMVLRSKIDTLCIKIGITTLSTDIKKLAQSRTDAVFVPPSDHEVMLIRQDHKNHIDSLKSKLALGLPLYKVKPWD